MSVRAKFAVDSVTYTKDAGSVKLTPVISGSEENKQFYRWTPGGSISLEVVNLDAVRQFVPGNAVYVDFTPAES